MADSQIIYTTVDEEYPVAGQDNDSQGFRDNFSAIKTALSQAQNELSQFLNEGARKDADNDFNGNTISNANILQITEQVYNTGSIQANTPINWDDGHFQNITVAADVTLTLGNWPASGDLGRMRLAVRSDGSSRVITWEADNAGSLFLDPNWPTGDFTVSSLTNPAIIDIWTSDGGATVFMEYKGVYSS